MDRPPHGGLESGWPPPPAAADSSRMTPKLRDRSSTDMTTGPQTRYRVRGGIPLQRTVLRNVPVIEDVRRAVELAQAVGAVVKFHEAERTLVVDASNLTSSVLPA